MNMTVSVCMITYNHQKFIREAIQSVFMQECDFEYELIIANDASTDNTDKMVQEALSDSPHKNKVKYFHHTQNIGMMNNFVFSFQQCRGKYIAYLEGDDYWIDSKKLQKQVEHLDKHPECGLVYTNYQTVDENSRIRNKVKYLALPPSGTILKELIVGGFPYPLTVCFRKELLGNLKDYLKTHYKMGDYPLWLELGRVSEFHYIDMISAAYRRHDNSVTANANSLQMKINFRESYIEIQKAFLNRYNIQEQNILEIAHKARLGPYLVCFAMAIQLEDKMLIEHYWSYLKNYGSAIPNKVKIQYRLTRWGYLGFVLLKAYRKRLGFHLKA